MYYELALISVVVAGGYWGWFYLRRQPGGSGLFGALLLGAVALCGLGLLGRAADVGALGALGAIGVGAGACMLVVGPALRALARRLAGGERYGLAARLFDVADVLAPGSGVGEEKALFGAMREIRHGHIEPTVEALRAAKTGAPPEARLAIDERIAMLYLAAFRWSDGVAHAEANLWPAVPAEPPAADPTAATPQALRRALGIAPPVWVELVGAYGRLGDLERAATLLLRLEDASAGRADAGVWLYRARLMFLALAGRVAAVEQMTAAAQSRHLDAAARIYWRAVALERDGQTAAATAAYDKARARARGQSRTLVEQAIARLGEAPPPPPTRGPTTAAVVARVEAAPPPTVPRVRRGPRAPATLGLTATLVATWLLVTLVVGPSSDPTVLLRAGAMTRTQIDAGEWWRVISCVFVHIGGAHMALNAISLWMIGRVCEDLLGTARTFAIFVLAGVAGGAISYAASPDPVSAGASGGVMGLLGAVFVELTLHRPRYRALWSRGVWGGIGIVLAAEVGFGFLFPVVDQYAHGAGLTTGALLGALLSPHARWGRAATYLARGLAVGALAMAGGSLALVARTSVADALTVAPSRAWVVGDGVTVDAPAAWRLSDGELYDPDLFLVLAFERPNPSAGLTADVAAWVASEPERARTRRFEAVAPATERVVALPPGWEGSELEVSYESPLGDREPYRVIVAGRVLGGRVVLASLYAPDSLARGEPELLAALLASAR